MSLGLDVYIAASEIQSICIVLATACMEPSAFLIRGIHLNCSRREARPTRDNASTAPETADWYPYHESTASSNAYVRLESCQLA